jgi:AcrR family transcriptional regulator
MKKNKWIRARSDEQKELRINEIVSATGRLFKNYSYKDITFVQIAKEAGFTRSNLYKYFKSKEEIFLEFLKHDAKLWKKELFRSLDKGKVYSIDEFVDTWVHSFNKNKRLIELISILYLHLEKEASYESLLNFKHSFTQHFGDIIEYLVGMIEGLSAEKVMEFINLQAIIAIGLYQMTDLSENQSKILEMPEYSHYKVDFNEQYIQSLKYILSGLLRK